MKFIVQAGNAPGNTSSDAHTMSGVHHMLSVWSDKDAMSACLTTAPHLEASRLFPGIASDKVVGDRASLTPDWAEVHAKWLDRRRVVSGREQSRLEARLQAFPTADTPSDLPDRIHSDDHQPPLRRCGNRRGWSLCPWPPAFALAAGVDGAAPICARTSQLLGSCGLDAALVMKTHHRICVRLLSDARRPLARPCPNPISCRKRIGPARCAGEPTRVINETSAQLDAMRARSVPEFRAAVGGSALQPLTFQAEDDTGNIGDMTGAHPGAGVRHHRDPQTADRHPRLPPSWDDLR
jgi:hypothetical protein